jgi:hypothetical protein
MIGITIKSSFLKTKSCLIMKNSSINSNIAAIAAITVYNAILETYS